MTRRHRQTRKAGTSTSATLARSRHSLVGRAVDLERARTTLAAGERVVIVRGPPGVGKSAFARALLALVRDGGREVVQVSLDGATTRSDVLARLAHAIGLRLRVDDLRIAFDRLAVAFERKGAVLFVDRVEGVLETLREFVNDLVQSTSGTAVVVAARERLGTPSEILLSLSGLSPEDAVKLLIDRAHRLEREREVDAAEAGRIVAAVGYLPLAIELMAARVALIGANEVLGSRYFELEALDQTLDQSYAVLSESQQAAFACLSVFRDPFSVAAASSVMRTFAHDPAADPGAVAPASPGEQAIEVLDRLVDLSLLETRDHDGHGGFVMADWVRAYATRQASHLGLLEAARERHAAYFAGLPVPRGNERDALSRLAREQRDYLYAWQWAIERADGYARTRVEVAGQLALSLDVTLINVGPVTLHQEVLQKTAALLAEWFTPGTWIDLTIAVARFHALRGDLETALAGWEGAIEHARRIGDAAREGWASAMATFSLRVLGRLDEADAHLRRASVVAQETRDTMLDAASHVYLGMVQLARGDARASQVLQQRALAIARSVHATRMEGIALANLGLAQRNFDPNGALETFEQARATMVRASDHFHLARVATYVAALEVELGATKASALTLDEALDAVIEQGDLEGELEARLALVQAAQAAGDRFLASRRFEELLVTLGRTRDVTWPPRVEAVRALLHGARELASPLRLRLAKGAHTFAVGDRQFDLSRRGPLRRIFLALGQAHRSDPGRALSVSEIQAAGWPGEKMRAESGNARVYMAIRRLRLLGLESTIRTSDLGYSLDPAVAVDLNTD